MKIFRQGEVEEAKAYALAGGQALHLHRIIVDRRKAPRCFVAAIDRGEDIAHLFDQDEFRLIATAKRLGVRVVVVSTCEQEDWAKDDEEDEDTIDDLQRGMAWLTSLNSKSVEANSITAGWIREWMAGTPNAATEAARLAKERKRLVKALEACATSSERAKEIMAAFGIPRGKRADLDGVAVERIREVLEKFSGNL